MNMALKQGPNWGYRAQNAFKHFGPDNQNSKFKNSKFEIQNSKIQNSKIQNDFDN
jgi:hypothetical protein